MAELQPGFAFTIPTEAGCFLVGVFTHEVPRIGSLVWVAQPTYAEKPTLEEAGAISEWRWPILLPLEATVRQGLALPIGQIAIPAPLQPFPTLRSGARKLGWTAFTEVGGERLQLGPTQDRSLPIYKVVNAKRLKEMIASGWNPEDEW
jgi:hypothetical protein